MKEQKTVYLQVVVKVKEHVTIPSDVTAEMVSDSVKGALGMACIDADVEVIRVFRGEDDPNKLGKH